MGWTKRQFVNAAFQELGLADYVFDVSPDDMTMAVNRLDAMMATWNADGIRVGYPIPSSPTYADLAAETNVPDSANEAIFLNLAIRIAPGFGKQVNPDTRISAKLAYSALMSKNAEIIPQQYGIVPSGAGNKSRFGRFIAQVEDPITTGMDGNLLFDGNAQLDGEDFS